MGIAQRDFCFSLSLRLSLSHHGEMTSSKVESHSQLFPSYLKHCLESLHDSLSSGADSLYSLVTDIRWEAENFDKSVSQAERTKNQSDPQPYPSLKKKLLEYHFYHPREIRHLDECIFPQIVHSLFVLKDLPLKLTTFSNASLTSKNSTFVPTSLYHIRIKAIEIFHLFSLLRTWRCLFSVAECRYFKIPPENCLQNFLSDKHDLVYELNSVTHSLLVEFYAGAGLGPLPDIRNVHWTRQSQMSKDDILHRLYTWTPYFQGNTPNDSLYCSYPPPSYGTKFAVDNDS